MACANHSRLDVFSGLARGCPACEAYARYEAERPATKHERRVAFRAARRPQLRGFVRWVTQWLAVSLALLGLGIVSGAINRL